MTMSVNESRAAQYERHEGLCEQLFNTIRTQPGIGRSTLLNMSCYSSYPSHAISKCLQRLRRRGYVTFDNGWFTNTTATAYQRTSLAAFTHELSEDTSSEDQPGDIDLGSTFPANDQHGEDES